MKTSTLTLDQATEARQIAENELATVRAQAEAAMIRDVARPLIEGYDVPPRRDEFAYSDPVTQGYRRNIHDRTLRRDRSDGRFIPVYETEVELAFQRMDARVLGAFDTVALGALESLTNYVIGTGIVVDVAAPDGVDTPDALLDDVQRFVDEFLQDNEIVGSLDREIHTSSREDGERFLELYRDGPHVLVDVREPDEITEPAGKRGLEDWLCDSGHLPASVVPSWSFGILTDRRWTSRAYGYHVVSDAAGNDWDFVPASRMVHVKRNVHRKAKRGVSDFFCPGHDLEIHGKLKRNIAEGSAIQAAIAFIREHAPGQAKADIERFVSGNATSEYTRSQVSGTRTVSVEQFRPGTVKDIPSGMKYHAGPLGSLTQPVFVSVAQYIMRIAGVRWCMPEYIISGDASNANFASTLVAESPFVKARENDQAFYANVYRRLIEKAIRMACAMGRFGRDQDADELLRAIDVQITLPQVASRDKAAQATANEILHRNRILSRRTWAAQSDLDYDEETQNMEDEPAPPSDPSGSSVLTAMESDARIGRLWRGYP